MTGSTIKTAGLIGLIVSMLAVTLEGVTVSTTQSGPWHDPLTWGGTAPGAGDDAIVAHNVAILASSVALSSATINAGVTLTFDGWSTILSATTVVVNGSVTHNVNTDTAAPWVADNRVYIDCTDLTVTASGSINVDAKGFQGGHVPSPEAYNPPGKGPGASNGETYTPGGGGYGGAGGDGFASSPGGSTYGTAAAPEWPGSGTGGEQGGGKGASGGGMVRIDATGLVTVDGSITADGQTFGSWFGRVGGSGGGVHISCDTFTGTGTIRANGGDGSRGGLERGGGSGGGGRLAIVYNTGSQTAVSPAPTVQLSASGGADSNGLQVLPRRRGQSGTIYLPDTSFYPTTAITGGARIVIPGFTSWTVASLAISGGVLDLPDGFDLTVTGDLTITGTGGLTMNNGALSVGGDLIMNVAAIGTLFVNGGAASSFSVAQDLLLTAGWFEVRWADTADPTVIDIDGNLTVSSGAQVHLYSGDGVDGLVDVAGDVSLSSASTVYVNSHPTAGSSPLLTAQNLTVSSDSGFNADGRGYRGGQGNADAVYNPPGHGPGGGQGGTHGAGGGGYGGAGGGSGFGAGGSVYGAASAPNLPGSGGGSCQLNWYTGGAGGGFIHLQIVQTAAIDGTLTANGTKGIGQWVGGGSGGAIKIDCETINGSGLLRAIGGDGLDGGAYNFGGGGGGGGRVAVCRVNDSWSGSEDVAGGLRGMGAATLTEDGDPGTVFWCNLGPVPKIWNGVGDWFADAGNWSPSPPTAGDETIIASGICQLTSSSPAVGDFTLTGGATLNFEGWTTVLTADSATIDGTVTHGVNTDLDGGDGWQPNARVNIVADDITIGATGLIDVDSKGFQGGHVPTPEVYNAPGKGPGASAGNTYTPGGAGYGGTGGTGFGAGGVTYGTVTAPEWPGSGTGGEQGSGKGASGGGLVCLTATGSVTVDGTITADGQSFSSLFGRVGGSGGGVHIACDTFSGTGTIRANGGNGSRGGLERGGGSGGGGRIAIVYDTGSQAGVSPTPTVQLAASGGADSNGLQVLPPRRGQSGTIYLPDTSFYPTNSLPGGAQIVIPGFTSWTVPSLSITGGVLDLPAGFQLTVVNDLTITGAGGLHLDNGTLTVGGNLNMSAQAIASVIIQGGASSAFSVGGNLTVSSGWFEMDWADSGDPTVIAVGGDLTVSAGSRLQLVSGENVGGLVAVGGNLSLTGASEIHPITNGVNGASPVLRSTDLTVSADSGIYSDATGFPGGLPTDGPYNPPGHGPGGGTGGTYGSGGGGHGGAGGDGVNGTVAGGAVNDELCGPVLPGSGGGGNQRVYPGGYGGGLVTIEASGTVVLDGTISVDGAKGTRSWSGGGAGGGINIGAVTFSGSGLMRAAGGDGLGFSGPAGRQGGGGGGGGGRIAVWRVGGSWSGATDVAGGTAGVNSTTPTPPNEDGGDGTVYFGDCALLESTAMGLLCEALDISAATSMEEFAEDAAQAVEDAFAALGCSFNAVCGAWALDSILQ